jgi:hypothetical protein
MAAHPALAGQQIDILMLDTTYCQPRWRFPPQGEAVAAMAAAMAREAAAEPGGWVARLSTLSWPQTCHCYATFLSLLLLLPLPQLLKAALLPHATRAAHIRVPPPCTAPPSSPACPAATLFVIGSYHIGKERAFLGAAYQLGWRVHCTPAKTKLLRLLGLPPNWLALLTGVPEEAQVGQNGGGGWLEWLGCRRYKSCRSC